MRGSNNMATVRYAGSDGIKVRSTAAGAVAVTLNESALMYDIAGVANVKKALNGTTYVWVKVHYYNVKDDSTDEGSGWVAKEYTTQVSKTVPSKSSVYNSNTTLKQNQMLTNARYVFSKLKDEGWETNPIYAILGNMEEESTINPGRWQNGYKTDSNGYGLVQWTPSTKLTKWCSNPSDIDKQIERIQYEVDNEDDNDIKQWDSDKNSPKMKFSAFIKSSKSVSVLAEYFVKCYEKNNPSSAEIKQRQSNATKWETLIGYLL